MAAPSVSSSPSSRRRPESDEYPDVKRHFQVGAMQNGLRRQFMPAQARHDDISQNEINGSVMSTEMHQGLFAVARCKHGIAGLLPNPRTNPQQRIAVFHEEDRFRSLRRAGGSRAHRG